MPSKSAPEGRTATALIGGLLLVGTLALGGCYAMRGSNGAGQTSFEGPRRLDPADVALPAGYRIEVVASGLTFPTGVAFDEHGRPHVTEAGYSYGEVWTTPRLLRIEPDGGLTTVAEGGRNGPWNGVAHHDGAFYVAEGGQLEGGAILRITPDGEITALVKGLPSRGDHHTNGPVVGPNGWLYFGQGTATNSGVVGQDNAKMGWLERFPDFHDQPCRDVILAGRNFTTPDSRRPRGTVATGAFSPFGQPTEAGQVIAGTVPCNGAIMRVRPEAGEPELIAWGLRNPFGLAFSPDGWLYATDNGYDERGSRPVFGAGDLLWRIAPGRWYGWPDFHGVRSLGSGGRYRPPGGQAPAPLLLEHPGTPPTPAAVLGVHASANGFDFSRNPAFGHVGQAFVAEFGDQAPGTGKVLSPVGAKVVRVDVRTGVVEDFAVNRGPVQGPASWTGGSGIERPVAARFDPEGTALYVVDFGVFTVDGDRYVPHPETGVLWRITWTSGPGRRAVGGRRVKRSLRRPLGLLALALLAASCGSARRSEPIAGPLALSPAAARGERVFMRHCHECHPQGESGLAPSINDKPLPGFLLRLQVRGGLGAMPEFGPHRISDAELDDLIAYLRELRRHG